MIYLDTHIGVWLYAGLVEKFNPTVKELINDHEVYISPIVRLELQYLFEIQRVTDNANTIVKDLANRLGLKICERDFNVIINQAMTFSWTRDPFDRLIVANAGLNDNILITKDQTILDNYPHARW
ncbi:MAG: PIN domain-containing protein [Chloroflexota bacterium]|nr:PIN domain-containing protein [Chloroflexota bacterium]